MIAWCVRDGKADVSSCGTLLSNLKSQRGICLSFSFIDSRRPDTLNEEVAKL